MINLEKEDQVLEKNEVSQENIDHVYDFAANLLVNKHKKPYEVEKILIEKGLDKETSRIIVENLENQIKALKKEKAKKDILYGALWCGGGIILTLANIGFIFWGAVIFGGYQLIKGLGNLD